MPTIGLVEDDGMVREMVEECLVSAGHTVVSAADTAIARQQADRHGEIALWVIDLVMPTGLPDGVEFARSLRADRPSLPVILMTGYYAAAVRMEDAPGRILFKPIEPEELLSEIDRCLTPGVR